MKYYLFNILFLAFISCNNSKVKTKRTDISLTKHETEIKLPITGNFVLYSYFTDKSDEYFSYKKGPWIYLIDLSINKITDSINTVFEKGQADKYGEISTFCFNGKDSLFLLLNRALIFIKNKELEKIIPINELDSTQYKNFRFANLENAPIYYYNKTNEIIGQVYCSVCFQKDKSFYKQKIIGGISLKDGNIKLYNMPYPNLYIKNYFGFANHVYSFNYDSLTFISLPCDTKIFLLNRNSNVEDSIWARSRFQNKDAKPLDTSLSQSREEKMRHMVIVPYYTEIRYDKNRGYIYRFYLNEISLKNMTGKYNSFNDKQLVLMILNQQNEVAGEYELDKYYNNFISFVGKKGLYINYFSRDPNDSDKKVFRLLTFN